MSTPKTPKKSLAQTTLENEQLASLTRQKAEEEDAIARRKDAIKKRSIGRQSLLKTSALGVAANPLGASTPAVGG